MPLYITSAQEGVDVNSVFVLDPSTPEFPAPPFPLGSVAYGTDGSEFVYVTAANAASIAAGSVLLISAVPGQWSVAQIGGATVATAPTGQLLAVAGGSTGSVAVPPIAGTQKGNYFWAQRAGNAPNVRSIASATKNAALFSSATTAGVVNSTAGGPGTTYQVTGLVISQANGSVAGPNTAILNYPAVGTSA